MLPRRCLLLFLGISFGSDSLSACSCLQLTLCQRVSRFPVIFLGKVVSGGVAPDEDRLAGGERFAKVRVVEAFRGVPLGTREIEIKTDFIPGMCAANPYVRGKEILVFSGPYPDGLVDGDCGSSLPAEGVAESLPFVRSRQRENRSGRAL